MKLRDYQEEALREVRYHYDRGVNRLLGHSATGLGKTIKALHVPEIFPDLIDNHGLLFIAHRREILFQAYDKFRRKYPDKWCGIEMGDHHATGYEDFVFVSVDSVGRIMSSRLNRRYRERMFGAVIVDEGHHAVADSTWDNVLTYFGVGSDTDSHLRLPGGNKPLSLFLTATPNRHDGKSLHHLVDEVAFSYDIIYGIRNGWLVDIRAHQIFDRSGAEELDFLYRIMRDHAIGERTLFFARSVEESQQLVDLINHNRLLRAGHIDHMTDVDHRTELLNGFSDGNVELLGNRLVLTEGYDNPAITQIIDNAPTKSKPLHIQKLGRGLRPSPDARVDDFATVKERRQSIELSSKSYLTYISTFDPTTHGLDMVATIWGRNHNVDAKGKLLVEEVIDRLEELEEEDPERPIEHIGSVDDIDVEINEVNLFNGTIRNDKLMAITKNRWITYEDSAVIYLPDNPIARANPKDRHYKGTPLIIEYKKNGKSWKGKAHYVGGWNGTRPLRAKSIDLPDMANAQRAIRSIDKSIDKYSDLALMARRGTKQPASDEHLRYLKNHSIPHNDGISDEVARFLIDDYRIKSAKVRKRDDT